MKWPVFPRGLVLGYWRLKVMIVPEIRELTVAFVTGEAVVTDRAFGRYSSVGSLGTEGR